MLTYDSVCVVYIREGTHSCRCVGSNLHCIALPWNKSSQCEESGVASDTNSEQVISSIDLVLDSIVSDDPITILYQWGLGRRRRRRKNICKDDLQGYCADLPLDMKGSVVSLSGNSNTQWSTKWSCNTYIHIKMAISTATLPYHLQVSSLYFHCCLLLTDPC